LKWSSREEQSNTHVRGDDAICITLPLHPPLDLPLHGQHLQLCAHQAVVIGSVQSTVYISTSLGM